MTMVGGFDVHRKQITFDYVDDDGLVRWGQIRPATRKTLRHWLAENCPDGDAEFALEGCTGWRYVVEELQAAGVTPHLGDPAETAALRGPKKRAKTDRTDARLLRTLLLEGRFPESWIPPAHVVEIRTLGRLYCTLMEERRAWQQRIHAQLFHQGCPPITALLSTAGREALATVELSVIGRQYVDTALRRIDELTVEIEPLRAQLVGFARHQAGCRALQDRHYGIGWLCAAIIWAEVGDARRFHSSDQLVRFAGMDVTVYSSDVKRSPGHLSRQGSPELRWAAFEAAKCAARPGSPDYAYYHQLAARPHHGKNPTLAATRTASSPLTEYAADLHRPQGRSSSLKCGRSTLTPAAIPPLQARAGTKPNNQKQPDPQLFTGVAITDKDQPCVQCRYRGSTARRRRRSSSLTNRSATVLLSSTCTPRVWRFPTCCSRVASISTGQTCRTCPAVRPPAWCAVHRPARTFAPVTGWPC